MGGVDGWVDGGGMEGGIEGKGEVRAWRGKGREDTCMHAWF